MKIKIHSADLNRMMKTISQCIDQRDQKLGNIEVIYDNNLLTIRGTNGTFAAVMSTPLLGGEGEHFCVDGTMFARVCSMCNGEVEISTDGKICTIKGAGRTRLPIVDVSIPAYQRVSGNEHAIRAEKFSKGFGSVAHALSSDQARLVLTGVLIESAGNGVSMVTLDGFKMAIEQVECDVPDNLKYIAPGGFMKLIAQSTFAGEDIKLKTDGKRIQAETDGMLISCVLLSGDYVDYKRILPTEFKTECLLNREQILNALKSGSVVNTSNNLVKIAVGKDTATVMSNSEQADFDADVMCDTHGDGLTIAFNQKFLMETINSIDAEEIVFQFNSPISPCVMHGKDKDGVRLVLPVRVQG